jgi:hypothetical protein
VVFLFELLSSFGEYLSYVENNSYFMVLKFSLIMEFSFEL